MNMYTNTKKSKKFILVLVLLMLFSFCYPKTVKAGIVDDIVAAPAKIFWILEEGVMKFLNNLFVNSAYKTDEVTEVLLTPESIIKGKFILFDANIFKEITNDKGYYDYKEGGAVTDGKIALRETISGWYYALRNFAIIALLSVLVYVGIRMIMSTVAQDKAKYKIMFKDWLVALCLVVLMHYIMIGILNISTMICDALAGGQNSNMIGKLTEDITYILSDEHRDNNEPYTYNGMTLGDAYAKIIVFGGIIVYTFIFAVKYLKREFTVIFLILLGPISCITYPIDKISDGKAQAFNKWFSEFLYEVIIQPFHLLLYIVLIGTAADLADANVIYAIICFAVMMPAEKFVKEMFGFKDKLGSPLGAMATAGAAGAAASKAMGALMNKGKGSGGGPIQKGDGSNSSTPNQLPPKTVDKGELSGAGGDNSSGSLGDGNGGEGQDTISQQDRPALEAGEEPGGGASAAAAYQNSDNPTGDADRAALEEQIADGQIDENDLTDEQRNLLGMDTNTDDGLAETAKDVATANAIEEAGNNNDGQKSLSEQMDDAQGQKETMRQIDDKTDKKEDEKDKNPEGETNEGNSSNTSKWDKFKDGVKEKGSKALAIHNQRVSKKYGSTQRGQRWKRRIGRGLKAGAKGVLKGGVIGLLGAATMTGLLLTGNGKEALGTATAIGGYAGKKVLDGGKKVIKGATGAVKDYGNGLRSDESKEKKALKDFKADPSQIDKAVMSYRENHDGEDPGYKELDQEMNDRFALSRYGLDDDQIDRAVGSYQELKESGVPENEALNQTVYAAKLAKDYSKKDFRSEKTMTEAVDSISQNFQKYGAPKEIADANARKYLTQASKIKGAEIALPSTNQTVDVQLPNLVSSLGVQQGDLSEAQLTRMNNMTLRLHQAGYNNSEIERIAKGCADSKMPSVHVVEAFNTKVEFLTDENAQQEAREWVAASNKVGTQNVTDEQIKVEMENRLELLSVGAKPEDMNGILVADEALYKSHSKDDRQMALDIAGKLSTREMSESREVDKIIESTAKELIKDGRASGNGIKKATEIVERAANFKGTTAVYTIKE